MSTPPKVDQRSIGELLLDADFQSRQLLLDVEGSDAPAMLRTWGEVVQAADDLWSALPTTPFSSPVEGATMYRLETMSRAQHRAQLARGWPGDGPTDERLLGIASNLQRAAELAAGPGRRVKPRTPAAYDDLYAARTRVMHILYVGAHAVGVAVYQHVGYLEAHPAGSHAAARETRAIPRGKDAMTRFSAFEQLAGRYVGGRFSQRMAGQHYTPPGDTSRLHQALVSWDIQAHRTMAVAPSTPNLHLVTRTQAMIMTASTAILNAAASAGRIDVDDYQHRLAPALDDNQQLWARAANRWGMLSSRGERADSALVNAANEAVAAVHEIAFDQTRWATPEVMAGRISLAEAAATMQQAMVAAADVACVHRDVVEREPSLTGSARAIAGWIRRAGESVPRPHTTGPESEEIAPIGPADIQMNRAVKLPARVRQVLVVEADQLVKVSQTVMSAVGALADVPRQVEETSGCPRCGVEKKHSQQGVSRERTRAGVRR